jgi:hypothetical protein
VGQTAGATGFFEGHAASIFFANLPDGTLGQYKKSKLTQRAIRPVLLLFLKVNGPLRPVKKL